MQISLNTHLQSTYMPLRELAHVSSSVSAVTGIGVHLLQQGCWLRGGIHLPVFTVLLWDKLQQVSSTYWLFMARVQTYKMKCAPFIQTSPPFNQHLCVASPTYFSLLACILVLVACKKVMSFSFLQCTEMFPLMTASVPDI